MLAAQHRLMFCGAVSLSIRRHMMKRGHSILNLGQVVLCKSSQLNVMKVEHNDYGYTMHSWLYNQSEDQGV